MQVCVRDEKTIPKKWTKPYLGHSKRSKGKRQSGRHSNRAAGSTHSLCLHQVTREEMKISHTHTVYASLLPRVKVLTPTENLPPQTTSHCECVCDRNSGEDQAESGGCKWFFVFSEFLYAANGPILWINSKNSQHTQILCNLFEMTEPILGILFNTKWLL